MRKLAEAVLFSSIGGSGCPVCPVISALIYNLTTLICDQFMIQLIHDRMLMPQAFRDNIVWRVIDFI